MDQLTEHEILHIFILVGLALNAQPYYWYVMLSLYIISATSDIISNNIFMISRLSSSSLMRTLKQ